MSLRSSKASLSSPSVQRQSITELAARAQALYKRVESGYVRNNTAARERSSELGGFLDSILRTQSADYGIPRESICSSTSMASLTRLDLQRPDTTVLYVNTIERELIGTEALFHHFLHENQSLLDTARFAESTYQHIYSHISPRALGCGHLLPNPQSSTKVTFLDVFSSGLSPYLGISSINRIAGLIWWALHNPFISMLKVETSGKTPSLSILECRFSTSMSLFPSTRRFSRKLYVWVVGSTWNSSRIESRTPTASSYISNFAQLSITIKKVPSSSSTPESFICSRTHRMFLNDPAVPSFWMISWYIARVGLKLGCREAHLKSFSAEVPSSSRRRVSRSCHGLKSGESCMLEVPEETAAESARGFSELISGKLDEFTLSGFEA
ncbi:dihydroxy-acid dehydratase [Striga asiatica]|uniref:Dihydroxy-acid dehydratase n=1 Tax=Striga asiatica TaxID=4170 RepID=A0A5A7P717_STRAF|nr:dihydroxy-acid dehydratase [Striga asiatica]